MAKAPLYFKQALEHAESEWSQHHAKAVIDAGGSKVGARVCDVMCLRCPAAHRPARRRTARPTCTPKHHPPPTPTPQT